MAKLIVNIDVDDLDRAVRFYTAALGLRIGRRFCLLQFEGRGYDEIATGYG